MAVAAVKWDGDMGSARAQQTAFQNGFQNNCSGLAQYMHSPGGLGSYQQGSYAEPADAADDAPATERTQEEIIAQCEARFAQIEAEGAERAAREARAAEARKTACDLCRWSRERNRPDFMKCANPLVLGFETHRYVYDTCSTGRRHSVLCGAEKALWEPRQPWWVRLGNWLEEKCK